MWQRPVQRPVGLPQARGRRHRGTILPCKPQAGPRLASPAGGPSPSSVKRPALRDHLILKEGVGSDDERLRGK